jgi:type III pantothenate kinase
MLLCLDVGNTDISIALLERGRLLKQFRYSHAHAFDPIRLQQDLEAFVQDYNIEATALCSVVPKLDAPIATLLKQSLAQTPFIIKPETQHLLKLDIPDASSLGADRLASAVAACQRYPKQNRLILDFGTATTICAICKNRGFLGGSILLGLEATAQALANKAAKLTYTATQKAPAALGKTTQSNIQSGLFWGHVGALAHLTQKIKQEAGFDPETITIATGGLAPLFNDTALFDIHLPHLIFEGIYQLWQAEQKQTKEAALKVT